MSGRAIVYGKIVSEKDKVSIGERFGPAAETLTWYSDLTLFDADSAPLTVFVDLDNPLYADADFLLSVATAGEKVKIIGKAKSPSLESAMRVAKLGVSEILTEAQCLERLRALLQELEEAPRRQQQVTTKFNTQALIGSSAAIAEIRKTIRLLSDVDFPSALILGDTGTGKSLISKVLHNSGIRADHNLVEVNCSAIPDELFESELFGHVRGAFTDAKSDKAGLFEYAENGTLFLDEVGNLSASAQAKLLKILEDKKLRKVGTVDEKDINVRVVAATNLDLERAIERGAFREDLYYRLNLLTIRIPPLGERPEDIPELIEYYLGYYATNYGKPGLMITPEAVQSMQQCRWPGNVRQLCNVIERAVLLTRSGAIGPDDVNVALRTGRITAADRRQIVVDLPDQGISLDEIEQNIVKQILNMCDWNKSETARLLRISRPRLRRIIDGAGLEQNRRKP
ncbi:MAG: sigma-54 dependent transcriptional regulator [candidate division Zixibacteria bacterium]|jgi:two-component system NtrC family response regulator|nr:sigma-54 dependent transcriptional regulator [candidate division Zixibacteria bacterium]